MGHTFVVVALEPNNVEVFVVEQEILEYVEEELHGAGGDVG